MAAYGSCPLACYIDPSSYCVDHGEGLEPERYQCMPCRDICPGPDEGTSTSQVSLTCIEQCKDFLHLSFLGLKQGTGFLGSSLAVDIIVLAVIAVLVIVVVAMFINLQRKKKREATIRRDQQGSGSNISGSSDVESPPDVHATLTPSSTITHVTVNQSNSASPKPKLSDPPLRRCHSEREMLLNSASDMDNNRHPVLHATDSAEGNIGPTEVLKC